MLSPAFSFVEGFGVLPLIVTHSALTILQWVQQPRLGTGGRPFGRRTRAEQLSLGWGDARVWENRFREERERMVMRRERKVSSRSLALATSSSTSIRTVTCLYLPRSQ